MENTQPAFNQINTKVSIADMIKIIATVIAVITAVTFFIYKMQDLPPRVDKLEQDLSETRKEFRTDINNLKSQMDKSSAKQDAMLDDLRVIKNYLLNGKGR